MEIRDYIKILIILFFIGCYRYLPENKVLEEKIDVSAQVKKIINNLIDYYEKKELNNFLSLVSPDYYQDKQLLEENVRKALSEEENIHLQIIVDKILKRNGKIFVKVNWYKSYLFNNRLIKRSGSSTFKFSIESGSLSLLYIEEPSPF